MHSLHYHNGIVHHNRNSKYESREREKVDGKSKDIHQHKGTDKSHRDSNHRNKRRTEILKEDEHHQEDENKRLYKSLDYLMD